MSLLSSLREEETLLARWIEAREADGPEKFDLEGAQVRLGRVRHMINSIDTPTDFGGWEDR